MENFWTLAMERVLISKPEYERERQWVSPDGRRAAYPIYVNENPQYFHPKDNRIVTVHYAASSCWFSYYCTGMLAAGTDSDLLNPTSWEKSPTPIFQQRLEDGVYGPADPPFLPSPDGTERCILYQAGSVPSSSTGEPKSHNPRLQKIGQDTDGMPDLGIPLSVNTPLPKPPGTVPSRQLFWGETCSSLTRAVLDLLRTGWSRKSRWWFYHPLLLSLTLLLLVACHLRKR